MPWRTRLRSTALVMNSETSSFRAMSRRHESCALAGRTPIALWPSPQR